MEQSYKLVALDVDGTLIDDQMCIPKQNIKTIQKLSKLGVKFVIVTGRPDRLIKPIIKQLSIESIVIGNNGATIRNTINDELLFYKAMPHSTISEIINYLLNKHLYFRVFGTNTLYSFNKDELNIATNKYYKYIEKIKQYYSVKLIKEINAIKEEIVKISVTIDNPSLVDGIIAELNKNQVNVTKANEKVIDINPIGIDKGNALLQYAKTLNIKQHEIVAIGDGENDIEMLNVVGYPVTLENGAKPLKKIAKFITTSNNDAGVSNALEHIFGDLLKKS